MRQLSNHYLSLPFRPNVTGVIPALRRFMEPLPPIARGWDWYSRRAFLVRDRRTASVATLLDRAVVPPVDPNEAAQYARFSSTDRWVAVAEPNSQLDGTVLRYVTISPSGVGTKIGEVDGGFVDLGEPQCPPGQCPPSDGPQFAALGEGAPPPFDPSHDVAVLSATRSTLWVLRDADAEAPARLASYDVVADAWQEHSMRGVGNVLAATYSVRDQVLWVLDEIRVGRHPFARILAVVPDTGHVTESARWPRVTRHDRFELAITSDQELYLVAGFGAAHVIALLEVSFDAVRLRGVRGGAGRLPAATTVLRADSRGVSVMERALEYEVVDHDRSSFTLGRMDSCL